jgi:hypothetical protein
MREEKNLDNQPPGLLFYRPVELTRHPAEVAQLVEQRPEKPRVRSSILRLGTIFKTNPKFQTTKSCKKIRNSN